MKKKWLNLEDQLMIHEKQFIDHKCRMIEKIITEYERASSIHKPFNSPHEGYAIIKEECDEMWDCIKENEVDHARREAMQVGAMALRFLIDIKPDPKSP